MKKAPGEGAFFIGRNEFDLNGRSAIRCAKSLDFKKMLSHTVAMSCQIRMLTVKNPGIPGFFMMPAKAFSDSYTFVMYLKENPMECKAAGVGQ
ncbi:hypothetical protein [Edaphobacillus lindanitolerans]|uniref:Uncharacterized protein n=1 Tax=Edaphobacillus lindanitolerans TaxID=550447 RepID=A0A1U7PHX1_9BACI|nr:hypothetical protein [Edaphobacillus lindanitolerans]SIT70269.1 hypothetical protein SAMN05428946_0588 [Edaphobacillus lindanitolerans]